MKNRALRLAWAHGWIAVCASLCGCVPVVASDPADNQTVTTSSAANGLPRSTLEIGGAYTASQFAACTQRVPYTMIKLGAATQLDDDDALPAWLPSDDKRRLTSAGDELVPGWARASDATRHLSVHMWKRHHHPNYPDSAARIAINGEPYLIPLSAVPQRWKNVPPQYRYAMSYVHPGFFDAVRETIDAAMQQGVSVFEFQDSLRDYFHDFSPLALNGFRAYVRTTSAGRQWPETIERFMASHRGQPQTATIRKFQREHRQLFAAWKRYHLDEVADFYRRLREAVRADARAAGLGTPSLLLHGWILQPDSLTVLPHLDGIWAEATPQISGFMAASTRDGAARARPEAQLTYPPNSALAALVRVYSGAAGGKQVIVTPFGMQMGFQLPFKRGGSETLMQLQLAQIYASGGSYTHWCAGIGPGTLGKGKVQSMLDDLPASHFDLKRQAAKASQPLNISAMAQFIRSNAELYDSFEPLPGLLILQTDASYSGEKADPVFGWVQLLDDIRVPNTVLIDGSTSLGTPQTLTGRRLCTHTALLVLSPPSAFSKAQRDAIAEYRQCSGEPVLAVDSNWQAQFRPGEVALVDDLGTRYLAQQRPERIRSAARAVFASPLEDNFGDRVIVRIDRHRQQQGRINIHLINLDYDWHTDTVRPVRNARLRLDLNRLGHGSTVPGRMSVVALDGVSSTAPVSREAGIVDLNLPSLGAYQVLRLD